MQIANQSRYGGDVSTHHAVRTRSTSTPRRVLVTGVGGFIGSVVARRLAASGVSVVGIEIATSGRQGRNLSTIDASLDRLIVADLLEIDLWPIVRSCDAIVHLAGSPGVQTSWSHGFDHHIRNNVVSTQRLLEAALDAPVQRIVVASSSSVYGNVINTGARETDALRPLSPYGASKAAMELLLGAYRERGLSTVPLRFFTVFGPQQRPDMAIHRMIEATRPGVSFTLRGDGSQIRSFTFVDDVARAVLAALDSSVTEPLNIAGTTATSINELIEIIESVTGAVVARSSADEAPGDPHRTAASIERARSVLGWEPAVDLRSGIERQVEWQLASAPAGR